MKKVYSIIISSVLTLIIFRIFDGLAILKIGTTKIGIDAYPKILFYIFVTLNFVVFFIANNKFYSIVKNQKYKYWKLFALTLLIAIITDLLFFFLQLIIFKFQPNYDPNIISHKELGVHYNGPKYDPLNGIFIQPFIQLYYYIPGLKFFAKDVIIYFLGQPIFLSFLIPFIIIIFKKKKNYK